MWRCHIRAVCPGALWERGRHTLRPTRCRSVAQNSRPGMGAAGNGLHHRVGVKTRCVLTSAWDNGSQNKKVPFVTSHLHDSVCPPRRRKCHRINAGVRRQQLEQALHSAHRRCSRTVMQPAWSPPPAAAPPGSALCRRRLRAPLPAPARLRRLPPAYTAPQPPRSPVGSRPPSSAGACPGERAAARWVPRCRERGEPGGDAPRGRRCSLRAAGRARRAGRHPAGLRSAPLPLPLPSRSRSRPALPFCGRCPPAPRCPCSAPPSSPRRGSLGAAAPRLTEGQRAGSRCVCYGLWALPAKAMAAFSLNALSVNLARAFPFSLERMKSPWFLALTAPNEAGAVRGYFLAALGCESHARPATSSWGPRTWRKETLPSSALLTVLSQRKSL